MIDPVALAFLTVIAGIYGLVIGSFLNVVAYRVPAGISLMRASLCPSCDAKIKPWHNVPVLGWVFLGGKCATCRAPISARYPVVEAVTGAAFALVTWWFIGGVSTGSTSGGVGSTIDGGSTGAQGSVAALVLVVLGYLYFAAISIVLTLIDLDTTRLPNAIVLPSYVVMVVLFTAACLFCADWWALLRAGIGMAVLYLFYAILRFVRPDGMGGGDVKLAGVVGFHLAWLGWDVLAVGAFAAFLLGGVFGLALIALRKAGRRTAIPFGPWMLAGAWTGILAGHPIGLLYSGLYSR